jgi:poly-beta-1,6-N-acetyl-D-glucosamine synthase
MHQTIESAIVKSVYIPVKVKFLIAMACAFLWAALSVYFAGYWLDQLARHIGWWLAASVITCVAIIPGFMNAFLLASLKMDRRPKRARLKVYPAITILTSAFNEEASIIATINGVGRQHYPGPLEMIMINDGSTDMTKALLGAADGSISWLKVINLPVNGGKAGALNLGLAQSSHDLIITLDADSYLYRGSLQSIVERFMEDPENTRAVAGAVLVHNSRESWVTKVQEWDYFHGIAAIKRVQSLYQGTLVAQGAFSIYCKKTLLEMGGWPDCVGEDIVLTWGILNAGYRIGHSEDACIFTNVPVTLIQFIRQRQRWSRGMVEAFKKYPNILIARRMSTFFIYWNLVFPLLDMMFTLFFIPGLVMALFGYYWIAGPMTLALIPIAMMGNFLMYTTEKKMFDKRGLRVRNNLQGFLMYSLAYNLIMQPVCFLGYISEMLNLKKSWGTK